MSNAKKFLIFSTVFCLLLCSCRSTDRTEIDRTAIEHSVAIARIENAINDYGKQVDGFITDIEYYSEQLGAGIISLEALLEQYFATVGELLHRYKQLQDFINSKGFYYKETYHDDNNTHSIDYYQDNS